MSEDNNIEEIELFSTTDGILIAQICSILEENNIRFVKNNLRSDKYVANIYATKKIFVSSEDYPKAKKLIDFTVEGNIYEEELPDELKNVDESYFEELVENGKISNYKKEDETVIKYISRREFKKKIKKEKILPNSKLSKFVLVLFALYLLVSYLCLGTFDKLHIDNDILKFQTLIMLVSLIPTFIIYIYKNIKINKMRKEFICGKEFDISECKIKKNFIIIAILFIVVSIIEMIYFSYSAIFSKPPILSKEIEKYNEFSKNESLFYDYYKCYDGKKYLVTKKSLYNNNPYYYVNLNEEGYVLFERKDILKEKIALGLPNNFQNLFEKMDKKDLQSMEENGSKLLAIYGFNEKDTTTKVNISIVETGYCLDKNVPSELNLEIYLMKKSGDSINKSNVKKSFKIINEGIKKVNNKNVGFYEYITEDGNTSMYQYICLYSIDGKLVKNTYAIFTQNDSEKSTKSYNILKEAISTDIANSLIIN